MHVLFCAVCPQAPADGPAAETGAKQWQHPPPQLYYGQLYGAFMKMTLSPLHQDAASSCAVSDIQACQALLLCDDACSYV
jgi:hypothetical protein